MKLINILRSLAVAAATISLSGTAAMAQDNSPWSYSLGASLGFSYDDNIYLQDTPPNPAIPNALPESEESFVTSAGISGGLTYKREAFNAALVPRAVSFRTVGF